MNNLSGGHFRIKDEYLHFMWLHHGFSFDVGKIYQNTDFLAHIGKKLYSYPIFVNVVMAVDSQKGIMVLGPPISGYCHFWWIFLF